MESQPQNPEFRNNPENFHPCGYIIRTSTWKYGCGAHGEQLIDFSNDHQHMFLLKREQTIHMRTRIQQQPDSVIQFVQVSVPKLRVKL